jgi:hypothetical protein
LRWQSGLNGRIGILSVFPEVAKHSRGSPPVRELRRAAWQERRRSRHVVVQGVDADPEAVCICGLAGVYMRRRKGGGRPIWRCEEHRDRWPDYAVEVPREASR